MTEILPCWKCGSPAHMLPTIDARVMIACPESGLGAEHGAWVIEDTEAEAISAWNTRAERTCHAELNAGRNAVVCSECGSSMLLEGWEEMKDWGGNTLINTFKTYPYCPKCGARVISENEPVEVWQSSSADDVTCYEVEQ